jgi:DNA invertase Pin-like site-specific DNA recombinase
MKLTIERKTFPKRLPKVKNVAAYARVSSSKDAMKHSLSAQVSYYSGYVQKHPGWRYVGVFADEGCTGTKETRAGFQRLLAECRAGNVDLVLTKSVSRFARNTVTLLETVRELRNLGVDVFFEEQNIHSLSTDGELMLSILASVAQAESLSVSENQKWKVRKNFEEGKPWSGVVYGYRLIDGRFIPVPEEATVVQRIFSEYLSGKGATAIANGLNADGIPPYRGTVWGQTVVAYMLKNRTYAGDLLLQKTYRDDHLTKKKLINDGVLPKYFAEGSHEGIIDRETFEAVQMETERRAAAHKHKKNSTEKYPFTGLIVCSHCGRHYRRKTVQNGFVWICPTYNSAGKAACPSKRIPEERLYELTADVELDKVSCISAEDGNVVKIRFYDGTELTRRWSDRSRALSWTDEMREEAKRKATERSAKNE